MPHPQRMVVDCKVINRPRAMSDADERKLVNAAIVTALNMIESKTARVKYDNKLVKYTITTDFVWIERNNITGYEFFIAIQTRHSRGFRMKLVIQPFEKKAIIAHRLTWQSRSETTDLKTLLHHHLS